MKHWRAYKKQFRSTRQYLVQVRGIALVILLLFSPLAFSFAQSATDLQNKIDQNNSAINKLEQDIASYQAQLDTLGQQKSSLSNSLKELDLTKEKFNANIAVTQNKINQTDLKIQNLSTNIGSKENSIKTDLDSIGLDIRDTDEL